MPGSYLFNYESYYNGLMTDLGQKFQEERESPKEEDNDVEEKILAIPPLFGTTTLRVFLLHQSED